MIFFSGETFYIGIMLICGSVFTFFMVMRYIRKSHVRIEDTFFWIFLSFALVILSLFPDIALDVATLFNIQSPINVVYLFIIFLLIVKLFFLSIRFSKLEIKVSELAQQVAINRKMGEEDCCAIAKKQEGQAAQSAAKNDEKTQ